jgi:predicted transcriptional regulator
VSEEENDGPVDVRELVRWAGRTQRNLELWAEQSQRNLDSLSEQTRRNLDSLAERTQRSLDFLAGQQAQFAVEVQVWREEQEERWRKADERWARTEQSIRALLAIAQSHEGEIAALREAQARLTESQGRTDRQMAETGERLSALINFVERFVSEPRGGSEGREG